jgi:TolA-binding protein
MTRAIIFTIVFTTAVLLVAGCQDGVSKDVRYRAYQPQEPAGQGFAVPNPTEVDLVETMAMHRGQYRQALERLADYYRGVGFATRAAWADKEIEQLNEMIQYRYLMPAEMAPADLNAAENIAPANIIYKDAKEQYEDAMILPGVVHEDNLRASLNGFNQVIVDYPTSDKIDDAAYYAGKIYEHFKDYEIAVVYYQRCFQWDDMTPYPARYRAARLMDHKLKMKDEALAIYRMAVAEESRYKTNTNNARQRIKALTRPKEGPVIEEDVQVEE